MLTSFFRYVVFLFKTHIYIVYINSKQSSSVDYNAFRKYWLTFLSTMVSIQPGAFADFNKTNLLAVTRILLGSIPWKDEDGTLWCPRKISKGGHSLRINPQEHSETKEMGSEAQWLSFLLLKEIKKNSRTEEVAQQLRVTRVKSQHRHRHSGLPVASLPCDLTPSSGLCGLLHAHSASKLIQKSQTYT